MGKYGMLIDFPFASRREVVEEEEKIELKQEDEGTILFSLKVLERIWIQLGGI